MVCMCVHVCACCVCTDACVGSAGVGGGGGLEGVCRHTCMRVFNKMCVCIHCASEYKLCHTTLSFSPVFSM